ncbi:MAG: efflux RND transporter periplasmic adaptor subunit [Gammaproteobacteria bacterium]|nr:efflux RND transporter periplasmic adaptor subunit [Gammaproteobacteria bacterium]MDE0368313.1 efflux RND transporter periplasmic adaptor subunit [Gammaproteobacteria bacterium]
MLRRIVTPIAVLIVAIGIGSALVLNRPEAKQQPRQPPVLLVDTLTATRVPTTFTVTTQGEVAPRTETTLISEVSGQIVEVSPSFVSGGFFREGELLVRIDPRIYDARVKRARANVAAARTQVATENAMAGYALEDWRRLQELREDDNWQREHTGRGHTREAPSDLTLRKPQLAAAIAQLESAEAELVEAEGDLERTSIRAPYSGMVREKLSDVGQYVRVGDRMASVFAVDYAEVRLPLTQADLQFLELPRSSGAAPVSVTLTARVAGMDQQWDGAVTRTEGVFDSRTRVLYAVAQVQDPYGIENAHPEPLRIGTFVNAEIQGRNAGALFAVPRHALYRGTTVWLVDDNNRLEAADVGIVRADTDYVYVDRGLEVGDRICITPMEQPLPGMPVRTS